MFGTSVDGCVKSLQRMRAKLLKVAEKAATDAASVDATADELRSKAAEHRRHKGRAENIADNLAKLLGD